MASGCEYNKMQIGTVKQIWRYAVKSMAGEQLESCSVGTLGIPADRGWAIRDEMSGEITNGKHVPLGSLETMRQFNPNATWEVRRFRPNFLIETERGIEGLIESEWVGREVRLGNVQIRCEIPTVRCGMTMQAQRNLAREASILRTIVKDADQNLGVYASVATPGE
jgi:uncharacterized protein YcbX